jgi:hypothetical protein
MNWKGQPLVSHEAVVNLIGHTGTRTGLPVRAVLDSHDDSTGQAVTPTQMTARSLKGHAFHPDWNYTLSPQALSHRS